jgi:carbon-monoxide dehydrogenase iron sulfur subunit
MHTKIVDRSKCKGCRNCELACLAKHVGGACTRDAHSAGWEGTKRSRNSVQLDERGLPGPQFCRHCDEPACVEACMTGAMSKESDGRVAYDAEKCAGCYMCVMSCPYDIARPALSGDRRLSKCDGCPDRDTPACVAACPSGCLQSTAYNGNAVEWQDNPNPRES